MNIAHTCVHALTKGSSEYSLRTYREGDEIALVHLFNEVHSKYAGFVPRTIEYWRWCCLERPDVERDGIFEVVDHNNGNVVGYAVVGRSGNVWELCYDSTHDGDKIVSLLLDKAASYLKKVGATSITFNAPQENRVVKKVCRKLGFEVLPTPRMIITVQNFPKLVSLILESKKEELMTRFDEAVLIKFNEAPFWISDTFFIEISRDGVQVGDETQSPTIQVETDVITFSSLLFGILSPLQSVMRLKLRVKPFWKTLTLLKLLSSLQMKTTWFFPLSDLG